MAYQEELKKQYEQE